MKLLSLEAPAFSIVQIGLLEGINGEKLKPETEMLSGENRFPVSEPGITVDDETEKRVVSERSDPTSGLMIPANPMVPEIGVCAKREDANPSPNNSDSVVDNLRLITAILQLSACQTNGPERKWSDSSLPRQRHDGGPIFACRPFSASCQAESRRGWEGGNSY